MLLQPVILGSQNAMSAVDGATIELRIRTSRPDEGRGRCKGSRAWDPRKDFSQCMQQPIILSTSNAISPQQELTEPSGHRPCIHGTKSSLRREPNGPGDLLRALFGNVTEPGVAIHIGPESFGNCHRSASGRRGAVADDARSREVRLCHSSWEKPRPWRRRTLQDTKRQR
jgi:hypothetical protein